MFCKTCGAEIPDTAIICSQCGYNPHDENNEEVKREQPSYTVSNASSKSRLLAGLLQILIPGFGIGRFYLGYSKTGLAQLIVTILSFYISGIGVVWGIVDGVLILAGSPLTDAYGTPMK